MFAAMITLPPFRGFVGDELAKLGGRHGHPNAANVGGPRLDLHIGETRIDLLVELVDHVDRRARRCADPWRLTSNSAKVNASDEPDTLVIIGGGSYSRRTMGVYRVGIISLVRALNAGDGRQRIVAFQSAID